jgi:dTMP kinase
VANFSSIKRRGAFISFEGLDGAGKTTQIALLTRWLDATGVPHITTREPGGTPLGVEIRALLFHHPELVITPLAEAFLFQADRAQHVATVIRPALSAGKLVITDRYFDSSIAYQGVARGVGVELVERLSLMATEGLVPDLTIYLDLDPAQVRERTDTDRDLAGLREQQSRFDSETEQFHRRLRTAFLSFAQKYADRFKVIDAGQPSEEIHRQIVLLVGRLLAAL